MTWSSEATHVFESSLINENVSAALTEQRALIAYQLDDGGGPPATPLWAAVIEWDGATLTETVSATEIESGNCDNLCIAPINATSAIICYRRGSYVRGIIVTVSGSSLLLGTEAQISASGTDLPYSVSVLTSTTALVVYSDGGTLTAQIVTTNVGARTISTNTAQTVDASAGNQVAATDLSSTLGLVIYAKSGAGYMRTLTLSGTTVTVNSEQSISANDPSNPDIVTLSTTKALASYTDVDNANYATVVVITTTGSTPSAATPVVVKSADCDPVQVTAFSGEWAAAYYLLTATNDIRFQLLDNTGSPIVASGSEFDFSPNVDIFRATKLSQTLAVVSYGDNGNSGYGTVQILTDDTLPAGVASFYHGTALSEGALAHKFNLPFGRVNPQGMTLDQSLGTVVIGAGEAAAPLVVYSRHPYASYTNNDDALPTGTAISSIRWI